MIAGPTHSGRTTALYALAAGCSASSWTPVWLPSDARLAARTIEKVIKKNDHVLLVDNTEQLLEALTNHARGTGADGLATLMQQGRVACTMSVASGGRIARHRRATVVLGALEDHEAALWSSPPRNLTSSPPGRGRWRESGTWKEVQIAHAEAMEIPDLVVPLPSPLLRSDLKSRDSSDTRQAVAVAGDTAQPWRPDPTAPVVVVGTPGQERTHISMLMRNCAQGVTEVSSVFNVTTVQRTDATVVVINPSPADIRELRHGHEAGVVETREIPYRAVVLTPEKVMAAQFFAPEG